MPKNLLFYVVVKIIVEADFKIIVDADVKIGIVFLVVAVVDALDTSVV
jgi:hypothetical protein